MISFSLLLALVGIYLVFGMEHSINAPPTDLEAAKRNILYWTANRMQAARNMLPLNMNVTSRNIQTRAVRNDINFTSHFLSAEQMETNPMRAIGRYRYSQNIGEYLPQIAAHCVHDGREWSSNMIFVPGYNSGKAPFGHFAAYTMRTLRKWTTTRDYAFDFANVILFNAHGRSVDEHVGFLNTAFSYMLFDISWSALGYPSEYPFDGSANYHCISDSVEQDEAYMPNTMRIGCDTLGGASGGPWLINYAEGSELYIGSVTSYKYRNEDRSIYGPFFGEEARRLFQSSVVISPYVL